MKRHLLILTFYFLSCSPGSKEKIDINRGIANSLENMAEYEIPISDTMITATLHCYCQKFSDTLIITFIRSYLYEGASLETTIINENFTMEAMTWIDVNGGDTKYQTKYKSVTLNTDNFVIGKALKGEFSYEGVSENKELKSETLKMNGRFSCTIEDNLFNVPWPTDYTN